MAHRLAVCPEGLEALKLVLHVNKEDTEEQGGALTLSGRPKSGTRHATRGALAAWQRGDLALGAT